jgi:hypothetical protein
VLCFVGDSLEAFRGLTVTRLKDLFNLLEIEVEGAVPTHLLDLLKILVKHALPELTDRQLEDIIHTRMKPQTAEFLETYITDNMELAVEAMHKDDQCRVEEEIKELQEELAKTAANKASVKPKAPPAKKRRLLGLFRGEVYSDEVLAGYVPRIRGCHVHIQADEWHHRVIVYYPRDVPPFSTSKTFALGGSQKAAAIFCLKWAWGQHLAATGVHCPWDFEELLQEPGRL